MISAKEENLRKLRNTYNLTLQALKEGDLDSATARGDEADILISEINQARETNDSITNLENQVRTIYTQIMTALKNGRKKTIADMQQAKIFKNAMSSYRSNISQTGKRLDITNI